MNRTSSLLIILFFIVAVILLSLHDKKIDFVKIENPVLIEQILSDVANFDGKSVTVVCYLNSASGYSISNFPSKDGYYVGVNSKMVTKGLHILTKTDSNWKNTMPDSFFYDKINFLNENLLVIQGVFHANGYDKKGTLLESSPYLQIFHVNILDGFLPEKKR